MGTLTPNLNSNLTQTCKESDFFVWLIRFLSSCPFRSPKGFPTCVAIRSLVHAQKGCMEKKGCGAEPRETFFIAYSRGWEKTPPLRLPSAIRIKSDMWWGKTLTLALNHFRFSARGVGMFFAPPPTSPAQTPIRIGVHCWGFFSIWGLAADKQKCFIC